MPTAGKGTFTIAAWEEKTWEGKDWKEGSLPMLTHARIALVFAGDLEGTCESQALMAYTENQIATYVGMQRVTGTLGGRRGAFMMEWRGTYQDGLAKVQWSVVPGSGSDELRGLSGQGGYEAGQTTPEIPYRLDYDFIERE